MVLKRRTAVLAAIAAIALCAAGAAAAAAASATTPAPAAPISNAGLKNGPAAPPAINWDSPLPRGKRSSMTAAITDGRLPFTPTAPRFSHNPALVEVTNPDDVNSPVMRAVAYVYHFPVGKDFPIDGRVRVLEYATQVTESQLEAVAANPPGPADDFHVIRVNGHGALLVEANGIGRVQFIEHGIMFDVTGPAVSPQEARKLASQINPK